VLDVPVENGREVEQASEGLEPGSGSSSLVIVDAVPLGKAFGDVSNLVPCDLPSVIAFALADKFAL